MLSSWSSSTWKSNQFILQPSFCYRYLPKVAKRRQKLPQVVKKAATNCHWLSKVATSCQKLPKLTTIQNTKQIQMRIQKRNDNTKQIQMIIQLMYQIQNQLAIVQRGPTFLLLKLIVQIVWLSRWVSDTHNVSNWMWPWPERIGAILGPIGSVWEDRLFDVTQL